MSENISWGTKQDKSAQNLKFVKHVFPIVPK